MSEELIKARPEEEEDISVQESDSENESQSGSSQSGSTKSGTSEDSSEEESSDEEGEYEIDLSDNDIYKGIYSFFEDEEGNTILDYINLLHNELIGVNENLKNVRLIRKDMTRIADSLEKLVTLKVSEMEEKKIKREQKK